DCDVVLGECERSYSGIYTGPYDCTCVDYYSQKPPAFVNAGESFCILNESDGVTYITSARGEIGGVRVSWWTKWLWRLNTVIIRNFKSWNGEDLAVALFLIALTVAGCTGAYCLIKTATASGIVDSCIVKEYEHSNRYTGPMYIVEGHRSWRGNEEIFVTKVREEAELKMQQVCPK
ncbi:MAG: hypothetical protein ABIP06_10105, partial [Pyrinomonadaceae bacterium]